MQGPGSGARDPGRFRRRGPTSDGPSSSTDTAPSRLEAPKSREQTEMKLRWEPGGSGKCSPKPRRLWLAYQDARRHCPPSWARGPRCRSPLAPRATRFVGGPASAQYAGARRCWGGGGRSPGAWSSPRVLPNQKVGLAGGASAGAELERGGDRPEPPTSRRPSLCLAWPLGV